MLLVTFKYKNYVFGKDSTFQQDRARPRAHLLTQQWCHDDFPVLIGKDYEPSNQPDLNSLDYCVWDQFMKVIKWNEVTFKIILIQELKKL